MITAGLLIYLAVLSYISYSKYAKKGDFTDYYVTIGVTLVIIILLWLLQTWRERMRDKMNQKDKDGKSE